MGGGQTLGSRNLRLKQLSEGRGQAMASPQAQDGPLSCTRSVPGWEQPARKPGVCAAQEAPSGPESVLIPIRGAQ